MARRKILALAAAVPLGMGWLASAGAQTLAPSVAAVDRLNAQLQPQDQQMIRQAGDTVRKVEASVQDLLVAYKPRHDSEMRHLGVPLLSHDSGWGLAYDLSGKNLMAQWKLSQTQLGGTTIDYQAFVSESGQVSVTLQTRF